MSRSINSKSDSIDLKENLENIEDVSATDLILERYPLIKDKSTEELAALNRAVLKKLDWRFLPCITMMLLMKCVTPELTNSPPCSILY